MIKREYVERLNAMLADEKAVSYLFLVGTSDDQTGVDWTASVYNMALMLANAAINSHDLLIAINAAFKMLEEYYSGQLPVEIIREGGGNDA